jgi:hypothetical protein
MDTVCGGYDSVMLDGPLQLGGDLLQRAALPLQHAINDRDCR